MSQAKHKVVFQLNTDNITEQNALVTYVTNVKKHWGDDVVIHVVAHGPGIELVSEKKTMLKESVRVLMDKGVQFIACQNTMEARQISKEDIFPSVVFTQSGVVYIIEKQEEGWAYIKCNL